MEGGLKINYEVNEEGGLEGTVKTSGKPGIAIRALYSAITELRKNEQKSSDKEDQMRFSKGLVMALLMSISDIYKYNLSRDDMEQLFEELLELIEKKSKP